MTNLINMTPHPINIVDANGVNLLTIPVSKSQIRLSVTTIDTGVTVNSIKITKTVFGDPVGLPDWEYNTYYIVSQLVKSALPDRSDLFVPAEMQRNKEGQIIGCLSLGI